MKTAALEAQDPHLASTLGRLASDFAELVKARLTLLVLLTTAVGFYLAAEPPVDYVALFHVVLGTAAAAAGAAALNQWWERRLDALMHRTRTRPIPAGRMRPLEAFALGVVLSIFGIGYLAIACNILSAVLAAITIVIYIFAYTPLKRTSTANTAVGASQARSRRWSVGQQLVERSIPAHGAFLPFSFCGNCLISSPSPGCIAMIIRVPASE